MTKFESGKTYQTRSAGDLDCILLFEVASRTAKTIKSAKGRTAGKTFRIYECHGVESIKPWGSYSMAPTISADRLAI